MAHSSPIHTATPFATLPRRLVAAAILALPLALSAQTALPGKDIRVQADTVYPEGIAWSPKAQAFFVSSIRHGSIGKVDAQGRYTPFIRDEQLVSSVGLALDPARNTLWVAVGDIGGSARTSPATQGKLAAVAAYDATTGARRAFHDLGHLHAGAHFANDLALDKQGNVYVTDSFSPVIYRIGPDGTASVFAQSEQFTGEGFNLNGIVVHPEGYLLVNKYNSGELFRIALDNPRDIAKVRLPQPIKGADGMLLREPGRLTVVQNDGVDQTVDLVSTDQWKTATVRRVQKSLASFPTTVTQVGKQAYVLNSRLDTLLTPDATRVSEFILQKY